jgi:putative addiction module component (TIGR02574 family)
MTQAVAHILEEVSRLSPTERAELADRLVSNLAEDAAPDVVAAQLEEVRRRVSEIDSGKVVLVPGEQAFAQIRGLIGG